MPHVPQLETSVIVSTQLPLQSIVPDGQPQVPEAHSSPASHAVSQSPQWASSVMRSTQIASASMPQIIIGAGHASVHAPPEQDSPMGHSLPQEPQFASSVIVSTQAAPHRISSDMQDAAVQVPDMHVSSVPQARPQLPQLASSLWTSMQPLPQSISPASHIIIAWQLPDEQVSPMAHMVPHDPQFEVSVSVLTQPPPQDVNPGAQPAASGRRLSLPPSTGVTVPSSPQPTNVASASAPTQANTVRDIYPSGQVPRAW
jgi:hypothetical protein